MDQQQIDALEDAGEAAPPAMSASAVAEWISWRVLLLAFTAAVMVGVAGALKLERLFAWKYTSDLFTYDQMLQEILRGHFGMEFTFGNQLGDHSLLIAFALAPLKLILGKHSIVMLTLLGPVVYGVMGGVLFLAVRATAGEATALLATLIYMIGVGTFRGICEETYGCHYDTFSGYVAVAASAVLAWRWHVAGQGGRTRPLDIFFWLLWCFFISLKEEMALLGVVFFATVWVMRRNRYHLIGFGITLGVFLVDMAIIKLSATPWNRTNASLAGALLTDIRAKGLMGVLFAPDRVAFWRVMRILIPVFPVLFFASRRPSPFALGLFAMGMTKIGFNFLVKDPNLYTWHNFPAIVMLTGAAIVQLQQMDYPGLRWPEGVRVGAAAALLALAIAGYNQIDQPYLEHHFVNAPESLKGDQAAARQAALETIKIPIDRKKVVAIAPFSAIDWVDGYRFSFYPRGVFWSPRGIADYLVLDKNFSPPECRDYLQKLGAAEFQKIAGNDFFELYERKAVDAEMNRDRIRFTSHFGEGAIGGPAPYPVVSPADRGGIKPDPMVR